MLGVNFIHIGEDSINFRIADAVEGGHDAWVPLCP